MKFKITNFILLMMCIVMLIYDCFHCDNAKILLILLGQIVATDLFVIIKKVELVGENRVINALISTLFIFLIAAFLLNNSLLVISLSIVVFAWISFYEKNFIYGMRFALLLLINFEAWSIFYLAFTFVDKPEWDVLFSNMTIDVLLIIFMLLSIENQKKWIDIVRKIVLITLQIGGIACLIIVLYSKINLNDNLIESNNSNQEIYITFSDGNALTYYDTYVYSEKLEYLENQQFYAVPNGDYYSITTKEGMLLEVCEKKEVEGQHVGLWQDEGHELQKWVIEKKTDSYEIKTLNGYSIVPIEDKYVGLSQEMDNKCYIKTHPDTIWGLIAKTNRIRTVAAQIVLAFGGIVFIVLFNKKRSSSHEIDNPDTLLQ